MKIEGLRLCEALRRIIERRPVMSDWRKLADGRVVRFVSWRA